MEKDILKRYEIKRRLEDANHKVFGQAIVEGF